MYYGFVLISVLLFGGCFAINDAYRKLRGSSVRASMKFSLISSLSGLVVLLVTNRFAVQYTPFTLLMAMLSALNGFAFTFCGFKALGSIDLSMYSLYSMLGGMLLPFLQGILFFGERMTLAKAVCCAFIVGALLLTVNGRKSGGGTVYYIGIFVLNGISGILSKIFASAPFPRTDAMSYSIWSALCSAAMAGLILVGFLRGKDDMTNNKPTAAVISFIGGAANSIANLLLVIALDHVQSSVQYPMVTGGVMIVSTAICFLGKNRPSKKEVLSILLAFIGMLALFIVPI